MEAPSERGVHTGCSRIRSSPLRVRCNKIVGFVEDTVLVVPVTFTFDTVVVPARDNPLANETAPLDTLKSSESKEATPFADVVASVAVFIFQLYVSH